MTQRQVLYISLVCFHCILFLRFRIDLGSGDRRSVVIDLGNRLCYVPKYMFCCQCWVYCPVYVPMIPGIDHFITFSIPIILYHLCTLKKATNIILHTRIYTTLLEKKVLVEPKMVIFLVSYMAPLKVLYKTLL